MLDCSKIMAGTIMTTYVVADSIKEFINLSIDKKYFRVRTHYDTEYPLRGYLKREQLDKEGQKMFDAYIATCIAREELEKELLKIVL